MLKIINIFEAFFIFSNAVIISALSLGFKIIRFSYD